METNLDNKLAIYQSADGALQLDVKLENEAVWLKRNQMALLFGRDVKTIGKHINNALREELRPGETTATEHNESKNPTVAKFTTVQKASFEIRSDGIASGIVVLAIAKPSIF